jgi:hypothetical protein
LDQVWCCGNSAEAAIFLPVAAILGCPVAWTPCNG